MSMSTRRATKARGQPTPRDISDMEPATEQQTGETLIQPTNETVTTALIHNTSNASIASVHNSPVQKRTKKTTKKPAATASKRPTVNSLSLVVSDLSNSSLIHANMISGLDKRITDSNQAMDRKLDRLLAAIDNIDTRANSNVNGSVNNVPQASVLQPAPTAIQPAPAQQPVATTLVAAPAAARPAPTRAPTVNHGLPPPSELVRTENRDGHIDALLAREDYAGASNQGTMLSCNCSDGNDDGSCTKLYPCFSLNVSYLLSGFPADHGQLHGQLFKDEETIQNSEALQHGCMVYYSRCEYHDPADEITQFSTIFGAPGTQFGCFYNRLNLDQILLDFYPDKVDPLFFSIALLLSALPILVGVFIFTYMSHICGWQHPCTSKPTIEILLEVQRRRQLGELPPSESQENLNVFAQPDLEGEVVAPPPYSRQGLSFDVEEDSRFQTQFPTVQEQNLPSEPPPPYSAVEDYERR